MRHLCNKCLWVEVPESCDLCFFKPLVIPKKPPIGIKPQYIHDEQRVRELRACIARYMQAGCKLDPLWVKEYNEIIERQKHGENNMHV